VELRTSMPDPINEKYRIRTIEVRI